LVEFLPFAFIYTKAKKKLEKSQPLHVCESPYIRMFPGMFGPIGLFQQPWMDPAAYMSGHWDYLFRSEAASAALGSPSSTAVSAGGSPPGFKLPHLSGLFKPQIEAPLTSRYDNLDRISTFVGDPQFVNGISVG
jgi:hypothetical protein